MDNIQYLSIYQRYAEYLDKTLKVFYFGIVIYTLGAALSATFPSSLAYKVIQLSQTAGLLCMIVATANIVQLRLNYSVSGILVTLYFAWTFFLIFHGLEYSYDNFKRIFFGELISYFFPLVLFFPKNLRFYRRVFDVIVILCIAFIIMTVLYLDVVLTYIEENVNAKFVFEYFVKFLAVPAGFILFTHIYHGKNRTRIALFVVICVLLIATYRARRALMALSVIHLIIFMVIYYFTAKKKLLIVCCLSLFLILIGVYGEKLYRETGPAMLENVMERGMEDTRSRVEKAFIQDFQTIDWVIGRGINGKYWCPGIDLNDNSGYRIMIETDYLNIILKGGIVHLVLILLLSLPAGFLALFSSKNLLSKAAGIWIFLWAMSLYPLNVFNSDFNHLLFWICVSIGYSKDIRNLSDETIKTALYETK